ncbi:hypothetical protein [Streptomyces sp. CAU 1734]|uniref:hypothetical protein n=1 Tax=Streptomyces sp. CAU 1734 TaxID=3140360 RepID=UPI003261647C
MSGPAEAPAHAGLPQYVAMARGRLGKLGPAASRIEAAVAGRAALRHSLGLDLRRLSPDDLVLELMELRGTLALLLSLSIPAAIPQSGALDDEDLVAHVFDLVSDAAPLHAEVSLRISRSLPDPLQAALLKGINAPRAHAAGEFVEARGHCGTSTVQITTLAVPEIPR